MLKLMLRNTKIYLFSNCRFILLCIIIKKSIIYLIFETGLQFMHFDGDPRMQNPQLPAPLLHPYHLYTEFMIS